MQGYEPNVCNRKIRFRNLYMKLLVLLRVAIISNRGVSPLVFRNQPLALLQVFTRHSKATYISCCQHVVCHSSRTSQDITGHQDFAIMFLVSSCLESEHYDCSTFKHL
jgi:hypothetical protein